MDAARDGSQSQIQIVQVVREYVNGWTGMHGDPAVIHVEEGIDPEEVHRCVVNTA